MTQNVNCTFYCTYSPHKKCRNVKMTWKLCSFAKNKSHPLWPWHNCKNLKVLSAGRLQSVEWANWDLQWSIFVRSSDILTQSREFFLTKIEWSEKKTSFLPAAAHSYVQFVLLRKFWCCFDLLILAVCDIIIHIQFSTQTNHCLQHKSVKSMFGQ